MEDIKIQPQVFPTKFNLKSLNPRCDLTLKIKKSEITAKECEKIARTYVENNYWRYLQIYTDGSKDTEKHLTGCAFTVPKYNVTQKFKLHPHLTVYTTELIAIMKALQWILETGPKK